MAVKDWVREAAEEINEKRIATLPPRVDVEMAIEIILRHSPFEGDVAYMQVPRCDGCRHWERDPKYVEAAGLCRVQNGEVIDKAPKICSDCGDYTIITDADFGCVQWERKK